MDILQKNALGKCLVDLVDLTYGNRNTLCDVLANDMIVRLER